MGCGAAHEGVEKTVVVRDGGNRVYIPGAFIVVNARAIAWWGPRVEETEEDRALVRSFNDEP